MCELCFFEMRRPLVVPKTRVHASWLLWGPTSLPLFVTLSCSILCGFAFFSDVKIITSPFVKEIVTTLAIKGGPSSPLFFLLDGWHSNVTPRLWETLIFVLWFSAILLLLLCIVIGVVVYMDLLQKKGRRGDILVWCNLMWLVSLLSSCLCSYVAYTHLMIWESDVFLKTSIFIFKCRYCQY